MRCLALVFVALFTPLLALAEGKTIIVLDASGSMWGQIDGRAKLDIAREALGTVLAGVPAGAEIGLMAYGHREKGSCDDIELVVPPGPGTAAAITDAADAMQFLGKTPLTEAVRRAAAELKSTEEKATVVLITDGIETCAADPCALGAELEATGVDFTAHVVGFGLTAEEGATVACLAENTGGLYLEAKNAMTLVAALSAIDALNTVTAVAPEPTPAPAPEPAPLAVEFNLAPQLYLVDGGPEITDDNTWDIFGINADGSNGEPVATKYGKYRGLLPAGDYRLVARVGEARAETDVTLSDTAMLEPRVILDAATLILRPRVTADAPVDTTASLNLTNAAGLNATTYGEATMIVPAMETTVTVRIGEATATETVSLAPGQTVELDIVVGAGVAVVDAYYVEGMIMDTTQHGVEILKAKKALDGSQESVAYSYGPGQTHTLPPGDYIARIRHDATAVDTEFTVKTGERTEVRMILNAGVLAISAPGASEIEVLDAKADISGNRLSRSFNYAAEKTLVAPGGDYLIVVKRGEVMAEATATVKPGERTEITVP